VSAGRILVTGASGFIGRRALEPLRRRGFDVHATARDASRIPALPGIMAHGVDLFDAAAATHLLEAVRPTHLLHFAWSVEHGAFWTSPANLDWLAGTLSLLRAFARAGGRRFVGAGTCAEYAPGETPRDEATSPLDPATLYGAAKASTFLTGRALAAQENVAFAWGRVFHLFGAGEAPGRLVPSLLEAHRAGTAIDCGPADQPFDLLDADDVADAFAHIAASDLTGAVNIGSGRVVTLRELSKALAVVAGREGAVRFGARPPGPRLVPRIERLASAGWRPGKTLEEGLRALTAAGESR
jgi:nucleoside-diphosphate-sugar epimerase